MILTNHFLAFILLNCYTIAIHLYHFQIPQKCSTSKNSKPLEIQETSSDFCLEDVSFLEHDSFFQKLDYKDDLTLVQDSLYSISSDCKNVQNNYENVNELSDEAKEEGKKVEANLAKWRQKYLRIYAKNYECGVCSCIFTSFNKLLLHDRTEHKDIDKKKICCKCNQLFISKQRLDTHIHLKHKEKAYECEICGLKSVSEKSLKVHRLRHSSKFQCNICSTSTSSQSSLEDHVRTHSSDRTYRCEICDQAFKQRQSLHHHMKSHPCNSGIEFMCNICSSTFKNLDTLKKHKNSHNNEMGFICEVCGAVLKSKSSLSVHKLNHKEKKHTCMVCDRGFSTSNLLKRHMLVHFTRPFVCSICKKSFNRADTLSLHMKTHSSLQTIFCKHCGQSFKLNKYLKRHLLRVHDNK